MKPKQQLPVDLKLAVKAGEVLRALNHELRQNILKLIMEQQPVRVKTIYKKLKMEQSVVSSHLTLLRQANLVINTRVGQSFDYTINTEGFKRLQQALELMVGSDA